MTGTDAPATAHGGLRLDRAGLRLDRPRLAWVGLVLATLVPPAVGIHDRQYATGWMVGAYAVLALFAVAFYHVLARVIRLRQTGETASRPWAGRWYLTLCVLATGVVAVAGENGVVMWFAMSQASLMLMPRREAWWSIGSIVVLVITVPPTLGLDWMVNLWFVVAIVGSAWATDSIFRLREANRELVAAQNAVAAMAVEQERLRFARDLHDIVGHTLTTATVKTQLARRLTGNDDERVRSELADVESLLRESLADVRSTVAGYREVTLAGELARAATVLEAAGIGAELPKTVDAVPGPRRELFGWVVREAVTNVVRHSRASRCWVTVSADAVEVRNDDAGRRPPVMTGPGSAAHRGLAGLAERVREAGGELIAGPVDGGGWRVRAAMSR